MLVKKKIRDLTTTEFIRWHKKNCEENIWADCDVCPFNFDDDDDLRLTCDYENEKEFFLNNKNEFLKLAPWFLNDEIEIEIQED